MPDPIGVSDRSLLVFGPGPLGVPARVKGFGGHDYLVGHSRTKSILCARVRVSSVGGSLNWIGGVER